MDALLAATVFLFGLAFGSFLNVCITRLPQDRSVVHPRSSCPSCGHGIRFRDNVPLVSWIGLRGKCRDCGAPISIRYPIVELATACVFLASYLHFGDYRLALKFALFGFLNIGLAFTDLEARLLPDEFTLGGLVLGLVLSLVTWVDGIAPLSASSIRVQSFANAALGALVGGGILFLIGEIYRLSRGREGMGLGDVKLAAMIGGFAGAKIVLLTVFLSAALAAVFGVGLLLVIMAKRWRRYRDRTRAVASARMAMQVIPLPFGTFLAAVAIFASFYGAVLLNWYLGA